MYLLITYSLMRRYYIAILPYNTGYCCRMTSMMLLASGNLSVYVDAGFNAD